MPAVLIKCPTTGKPVNTGFNMDKKSFESSTLESNAIGCPHCGKAHVWSKAGAYLENDSAKETGH